MSSLRSYLAKLEACLGGLPPSAQQAVMEELRGHLEDRAAALRANGLKEEASMSEAIERFGKAREVGAALRDVHGRGSWGEALAGMVPFLVFGLAMTLNEYLVRPVWSAYGTTVYCFVACYFVLLVGLGVGWMKGFPRWSYPYGGLVLVCTWWWMGLNSPRVWIFNGPGAWIPLLVLVAIILVLTRSWRPLRQLLAGVWHDWPRLSFGLYGCMPLVVWLLFDEVTAPYPAPYLAASAVILAVGALAYVRSARTSQRALALLMAMTLAWGVTTVGTATYWHGLQKLWMTEPGHRYAVVQGMVIAWGVLAGLTFAPVLLSLLRRPGKSARAG
ncbi:MAG TPA: hypothetical protein EYP49_13730 [Anaerolineae bacterium]|nr:hypothetical protein [Anaerolineae bacterium]